MAKTTAADIANRESIRQWIDARPELHRRQEAVLLASRAALRVLPLIKKSSRANQKQFAEMLNSVFWCSAISRVASTSPTREIVFSALAAYSAAAAAAKDHVAFADAAAKDDVAFADAALFAAAVAFADARAYADAADAAFSVYDTDAAYTSLAAARLASSAYQVWASLRDDAGKIEQGVELLKLASQPIWPTGAPGWWIIIRPEFEHSLEADELGADGFDIWAEWYECVAFGEKLFGINNPTIVAELERNIALGSTDGEFDKEFWKREPALINADIKRWVEDAKLAAAVKSGQNNGLKFDVSNGMVKLAQGFGLISDGSNTKRINAQLPILRELVVGLEKKVGNNVPDDDLLLKSLAAMKSLVDCEASKIDADALFARNIILRDHIEEAKKNATSQANYYQLTGRDLATAKSIALTADLIVLATLEGEKLFADADEASGDAGKWETYREIEKQLLDILVSEASLMDDSTVELLKLLFVIPATTDHPNRAFYFSSQSLRNLAIVTVAYAVATYPGLQTSAIWIAGAIGAEQLAEQFMVGTRVGDMLKDNRVAAIERLTDNLLKQAKPKIKQLSEAGYSFKLVNDLLERLEQQKDQSKK